MTLRPASGGCLVAVLVAACGSPVSLVADAGAAALLASSDAGPAPLDQPCACGGAECLGDGGCGVCLTAADCPGASLCCAGACVDGTRDPQHCGACGMLCPNHQFCAARGCTEATWANLCELPAARSVLTGRDDDDRVGLDMASALAAACEPQLNQRSSGQEEPGLLDATTGEPLLLGELLVLGGGAMDQRAVGWLERVALVPALYGDETRWRVELPNGTDVASGPWSALHPGRDVVLVELVHTPRGAMVLKAAGYSLWGSGAAGWYFINQVLPHRATTRTTWTLVEWVDVNANWLADADDAWTVLATGP